MPLPVTFYWQNPIVYVGGHFCYFFRGAPVAYGGFQSMGLIRAAAASLHHSHSNMGSESCLQPTPQLTTTPDP